MDNGFMNKYVVLLRSNIFKITTLVLFLIVLVVSFVNISFQQKLKDTTQKLAFKSEEYELCIDDKAKIIEESKQTYSPQEFKISSPLFEGKEMTVKMLGYKGTEIKEMTIDLPQSDQLGHPINIKVWDYINVPNPKMARFDQYYNAFPLWAETVNDNLTNYFTYKTTSGFSMNRACGELTISRSITSIHSIYVLISGYQCTGIFPGKEEETIRESTKFLEEVADTINF
ncbi:hypothetical protein A2V97_00180 [Candidatus Woesebacteria bacterium RBG_16_42_24]|uniref:Uncharacterized protein n=1 Tax=Candidatus Woesebacteria bacterium RBG_16_42_24 TaxID=1802485 RepID=A0A1F7XLH9_9BACT|nr:MAG: hypothetical protein A2V97_00180 [Candidatus Woesebacteria bacterium RBG_16_42_24]